MQTDPVAATRGISCTGCDIFGKSPVKIEGHEHVRVVMCGTCHRTWFRPDATSDKWVLASADEAVSLQDTFGVTVL